MKITNTKTCTYGCYYRIAFTTRGSRPALTAAIAACFKGLANDVAERHDVVIKSCAVYGECCPVLVLSTKPKACMSSVVKALKSGTAMQLLRRFPELRTDVARSHLWNTNFFIETIATDADDALRTYFEIQLRRVNDER